MIQDRDDIVALDSAIIQHPRTWEASGHLAGFTDPLVDCRTCKQRFRADHLGELAVRPQAVEAPGRGRAVRPDRGARVQPDVRDDDRPREGGRLDRLPAAGDRAGHLPRLQAGAAVRAPQAAVRHRPGRQVVPQRDHAGQLHLPHARVRADGDGVLRPARRGRAGGTSTGSRSASTGTCGSASSPSDLRLRAHDAGRAVALLVRDERRRVPASRSAGRSWRGSRTAATSTSRQHARALGREARVRRPAERRALRPARDRAGRRRRPLAARVPLRRLRRGRDRRRAAHRAAAAPGARAGQGRRAAAAAQGRPPGAGARGLRGRCAATSRRSTTTAARSAAATGARTRSARRSRSRSTTRRSRTTRSRCATATRSRRSASAIDGLARLLQDRLDRRQ